MAAQDGLAESGLTVGAFYQPQRGDKYLQRELIFNHVTRQSRFSECPVSCR